MMEVILRETVKDLGKAGQLVRVKPGYARNFLLPKGLAYEATEGNKRRIEGEQKARESRDSAERNEAQRQAQALGSLTVSITGKAGEEGKLFGSITAQDVAEALAAQGQQVDRRKLELDQPIKTLGFHTIPLRLHPDVLAEVRVQVVAE
jgi:large subunit ribosomal protein L9